jgi:hypothetical protein
LQEQYWESRHATVDYLYVFKIATRELLRYDRILL